MYGSSVDIVSTWSLTCGLSVYETAAYPVRA